MRILCKEKDYYDYIGAENGYDKDDIVFDRRNMRVLKAGYEYADWDTIDHVVDTLLTDRCKPQSYAVYGLWIGYNFYVFGLSGDVDRYVDNTYKMLKKDWKWSAELISNFKLYNVPHKNPIELVEIEVALNFQYFRKLNGSWRNFRTKYDLARKDSQINELQTGNPANWKLKTIWGEDKIPILKNTWIPKFVSAKDAYYGIEEWLLAQKNDVDQESKDLSDVDKAVNHGFDKKSSFRNVK